MSRPTSRPLTISPSHPPLEFFDAREYAASEADSEEEEEEEEEGSDDSSHETETEDDSMFLEAVTSQVTLA